VLTEKQNIDKESGGIYANMKGVFVVREFGTHVNHEPTQTRRRKWTEEQSSALSAAMPVSSSQQLWDCLDATLFKDAGITPTAVTAWWESHKRKHANVNTIRRPTLGDLRDVIKDLTQNPIGSHDAFLVPLPGSPHLLTGRHVKQRTGDTKPRQTMAGTSFAFCIPGTTQALMSRIPSSRSQIYSRLVDISVNGFRMSKVKESHLPMVSWTW
jgi:hypothetical protein